MSAGSPTLAERLADVQGRIAEACRAAGRDPQEVQLIAVSKRQPDALLMEAYAAGHRDFGENYAQELLRKQELLPPDARLHMIGAVQTKKAKALVGAHRIHTLDRDKLLQALDKAAATRGVTEVPTLLQVRLGGEAHKAGVDPDQAEALLSQVLASAHVRCLGLMCIPPPGEGRRHFAALRALRDQLHTNLGTPLPELSMGMSGDYEDAIREGATVVRVGTAIFGPRTS